jgi:Icc-related predicted phosphoesterase
MKIYAVADIHGSEEDLKKMGQVITHHHPDLLVIAGDIFNYRMPESVVEKLRMFRLPVLGVLGNSDLFWNRRKQVTNTPVRIMADTPYRWGGFSFIGINGTVPLPFASKAGIFENRAIERIKPNITAKTILVVHPPPRGTLDRVAGRFRAGSFRIRALIDSHPPMLVLCGHIHEQAGFEYIKNTAVVNCALNKKRFGAIIECTEDAPLKIEMINRG